MTYDISISHLYSSDVFNVCTQYVFIYIGHLKFHYKMQIVSGFCGICLNKYVRWTYVIDVGHKFCVFILCIYLSVCSSHLLQQPQEGSLKIMRRQSGGSLSK